MIYEYQCLKCGKKFDLLDKEKKVCKCGNEKLKRLFPTPGFILKGSGFYKNDYPKK